MEIRIAVADRDDLKGKSGPGSLLPPQSRRPSRREPEQFARQSPSSLLPDEPRKPPRDPARDDVVAVSPSSLLSSGELSPAEPQKLPRRSPSSLLPEPAPALRESGREGLVAVSPSSLLPPEPTPRAEQGRLSQRGPSSLLPEPPDRGDHEPPREDLVAVSPSSLLPDSAAESRTSVREDLVAVSPSELLFPSTGSRWSQWINRWTLGIAAAVVVLASAAIFLSRYESTSHLLRNAATALDAGDYTGAADRLGRVLNRQPAHAEARFLMGRARLGQGDPKAAEAELRRAIDAGWRKQDTHLDLARALLRQGKFQALLHEILPDDADSASQPGPINALRGLAQLALGNESEARSAFEKALMQSPENPDALLGLARIAEREKRLDDADALIARALRTDPGKSDGWLLKGELQWR